jgi:hypothetical protein
MRSFITCTLCKLIRIIKSRRMRWWAGHVAQVENRNAYRLLVGKPEGTPRCKLVDLGETGWGGMD